MAEGGGNTNLPIRLRAYILLTCAVGMAWLAYLVLWGEWEPSTYGEMGLFFVLIVVAGSFPLSVTPGVKADVTTAVLFAAALLLGPAAATVTAVAGILVTYIVIRLWGDALRLPGYIYPFHKYPFNLGETALSVGLTSALFHALTAGDGILAAAVVPAAACMYLLNTALVSGAVKLELGVNPVRVWWEGTRENGLAELSLFAFGFLGAVAYRESPWTVLALFIPVAIIYLAFSRLANANTQLEEALRKLEALQGRILSTSKLASIGALSLDLAHQIKNPLAIVLGRLEELQDRMEGGSRDRRNLDIAMEAGWRIQELTHTFASIGRHKWVELDIGELLDEALGMAGLRNRKRIETRRDYREGPLKVRGNPVLIREALSNIFSNAMEAVDQGGVISIGASRVNGAVIARISDNGAGIPRDKMVHMFEPFYSTKTNGHGLGLFAAKHILEMHHGGVEIDSVDGEGTVVTVRFPTTPASYEPPEESSDSLLSAPSL